MKLTATSKLGGSTTFAEDTSMFFTAFEQMVTEWKLSIVIPVFNECATLEEIVHRVRSSDLTVNLDLITNAQEHITLSREIVIVDDGSTDGTRDILNRWLLNPSEDLKIVFHQQNGGKGAALRTGFAHATGNLIVIQDADLEYDPRDFATLIKPILAGTSFVVYGSRFSGGQRGTMSFSHSIGNKLLTILTNILYGTSLSDMETCYKCFHRDVIAGVPLRSRRFEIEPELTAKILKRGYTICEVPISYSGRSLSDGKKLTWRDGFSAIRTLVRYRVVD